MFWRSEIVKKKSENTNPFEKKMLGLLDESKKPPPHIHSVRHYRKMYMVLLRRRMGGMEEAALRYCLS